MRYWYDHVAPLAGARIEISSFLVKSTIGFVAPLAGARIEIKQYIDKISSTNVAPLAGARIEIYNLDYVFGWKESLPSRERGLKFLSL